MEFFLGRLSLPLNSPSESLLRPKVKAKLIASAELWILYQMR